MRQKHTHGERDRKTLKDTHRDTQRHANREGHTNQETHTLREKNTLRDTHRDTQRLLECIPGISSWTNANLLFLCSALTLHSFFTLWCLIIVISSSAGVTCGVVSEFFSSRHLLNGFTFPLWCFPDGFPCFSWVHFLGFLLYFSRVLNCALQGWTAGNLISWLNGISVYYIFTSFVKCYLLISVVLCSIRKNFQKCSTGIQCSYMLWVICYYICSVKRFETIVFKPCV